MALVLTFRLPKDVCTALAPEKKGPALAVSIKNILLEGLRAKVPVAGMEVAMDTPTERFNLSMPEASATIIRAMANDLGVTPRHVCQGILLAMAARSSGGETKIAPELKKIIGALNKAGEKLIPQTEQNRFYGYLMDAMNTGVVGLCEAGTGTGKSLAMLAASKLKLELSPDSRLVIACPTLMLMEQFVQRYEKMKNAGIAMPGKRVIIGRREFVSPTEVLRVATSGTVDADVDIEAVLNWVGAGGKATQSHWCDRPWLAGVLAKVAPGFPVEAVLVADTAEEDDPGLLSYSEQFHVDEDEPANEIIFCTHAMLAVDIRHRMIQAGRDGEYWELKEKLREEITGLFGTMKKADDKQGRKDIITRIAEKKSETLAHGVEISRDRGRLPPYQFLLVDEAHLLEQGFSNTLSNQLSLFSFWRGLEEYRHSGGKISAKSIDHIGNQLKKLAAMASHADDDLVPLDIDNIVSHTVIDILKEICSAASIISSARSNTQTHKLIRLKRELKLICTASERRTHARAYIQFSPVKAFPRILMGAPSVNHALSFLWTGCRSAACVSATLYLPRGEGFSSAYQAGLLAIPKERQKEYTPVVPEWTYSTVEGAYLPENVKKSNGRLWLRPPTRSDRLNDTQKSAAETDWLNDLAGAVEHIHADAKGGVLVLMTSYSSIDGLTIALSDNCRNALVTATPDISLTTQRKRYLSHVHHGRKPIWLAVGGAWTGLDIGGHAPWKEIFGEELPADQDDVLTDIVIARIPFGTNKTITHMSRLERNSTVPWEVLDAMFRIKQGIGRLVRRPGLKANRRIFILDGRLNDEAFAGYLSRIQALVRPYVAKTLERDT